MQTTITVNGHEVTLVSRSLSFEELVALAGKNGTPTVTYKHREGVSGTLLPGEVLGVSDGTVVNVMDTTNA